MIDPERQASIEAIATANPGAEFADVATNSVLRTGWGLLSPQREAERERAIRSVAIDQALRNSHGGREAELIVADAAAFADFVLNGAKTAE